MSPLGAPKAADRFKERVRDLTRLTRGVSVEGMAEELARHLRGWLGYFGGCETPSVAPLGHASITCTMRCAHSYGEAKRRAVRRLKTSDKVAAIVELKRKVAV